MSVAGTSEKQGQLGSLSYVIEDEVCKLLDRSAFAGSIATADRLLRVVTDAGLDVTEACKMGCATPAELFGLNKGRLEVGYDGDIVIADKNFDVNNVFIKGEQIK